MPAASSLLCILLSLIGLSCSTAPQVDAPLAPSSISGRTATTTTTTIPKRWAFPGAQGFGSNTIGGRGGRVLLVTNLHDTGPGSLRAAVEATGPRIVVFRVSGTITQMSRINIKNPYITIAGQTAPGGGITLRSNPCNSDGTMRIHTHDVVIRYLRLRPGPYPCAGLHSSGDALTVENPETYRVVIDHCSLSWAVDEDLGVWDDAHWLTFSWNIISEGLSHSTHTGGEHSKGAHLSGSRTYGVSFHHNLLAHNNDRNPQPTNPGIADIRNNVIYNYGYNAALTSNAHGRPYFNFVNNYYRPGPNSKAYHYELVDYGDPAVGWRYFVQGNIGPHRLSQTLPQADTVDPSARANMVGKPYPAPYVTTWAVSTAYPKVLDLAGARIPYRDPVDARVVRDVKNLTGHIIDDPSQVGGWPVLPAKAAPRDSDHDGMPDTWEVNNGLNPNVYNAAGDKDQDGWTNIEEYLNWLVRPGV